MPGNEGDAKSPVRAKMFTLALIIIYSQGFWRASLASMNICIRHLFFFKAVLSSLPAAVAPPSGSDILLLLALCQFSASR